MSPRCPGQDTRYWKGDSAFDIRCPHCGGAVEFFRDEPVRTCRSCRRKVQNPRLDLACAKWCKYADECLGRMPNAGGQVGSLCRRIVEKMKSVFGDDQPRIDHALAVLEYAEQILTSCPDVSGLVVRAAAILHDIGIHEAQRTHGSTAGKYQELKGPPVARKILKALKIDPPIIDHVCRIIANHHSAKDIDTPEFRIVWDADWLVNIPDRFDTSDKAQMSELIEKTFKTDRGRKIAGILYGIPLS